MTLDGLLSAPPTDGRRRKAETQLRELIERASEDPSILKGALGATFWRALKNAEMRL